MSLIKKIFGFEKEKPKSKNIEKPQAKFLDEEDDKVSHTMPITRQLPKEHYIIKHHGEYLIFDSKDEMPQELRDGIEEIESLDSISSVYNVIVDGQRLRYKNYSEIPEEIRKILENRKS